MADNKYRRYLNNDNEERPRSSILDDILKVGAIAGGVIAGVGVLSHFSENGQLARGLSKFNNKISYLDNYMSGLNKTFKDEGVFKTLLGEAQESLEKNMSESFTPYAANKLRQEAGLGTLSGAPTAYEKLYSKIGKNRRDIGEQVVKSTRIDNILNEVRNSDWYGSNPALGKEIENAISKDHGIANAGFGKTFKDKVVENARNMSPEQRVGAINSAIDNALEKYGIKARFSEDIGYGTIIDNLKATVNNYSDINDYIRTNEAGIRGPYKDAVTQEVKRLKEAHDKQLVEYAKRETVSNKAIQTMFPEYKTLTVGQAQKMGLFDYTSITTKSVKNGKFENVMMKPRVLDGLHGIEKAPVDPLVFIDSHGQVVDLRTMKSAASKVGKGLSNNFQIPLLGIKPFKLFSVFKREAIEDVPTYIYKRQDVSSVAKYMAKDLAEDDYYFMYGNIVNRKGETVTSDIRLANSKFGLFQREMSRMSGYTKRIESDVPKNMWDRVKDALDVGNQEYESAVSRKLSGLTKFTNPEWERNILKRIKETNGDQEKAILEKAYGKFMNTVDNMTSSLSEGTVKAISAKINPELYGTLTEGTRAEGVMNTMLKMLQSGNLRDETEYEFANILNRYSKSPDSFERVVRTARKGYQADLPEVLDSVRINSTEAITSIDQAEKLLHMELLNQTQDLGKDYTVGKMVKEMLSAGTMNQKQANEVLDLYTLSDLRNLGRRGKLTEHGKFAAVIKQPEGESQEVISQHLEQMIRKANPDFGVGPGEAQISNYKNIDFIPTRNGTVTSRAQQTVANINETLKRNGSLKNIDFSQLTDIGQQIEQFAGETFSELGFGKNRAGRDNLDKVTNTTLKGYHYLFRLDEGLSKLGLGMSTKNMGSTQDLAKNLFLKRILGPLAIVAGLSYLNYESGNVLGQKPNQILGKTYAQMSLDIQGLKDITGINAIGQGINRTLPGFNLLYENPLGMALKYGSFGLFGENRGKSEMEYYYTKGWDPIRKGRFWGIGSNTPFYGDRISYFAPSWYRQMIGEPQFTEDLYGSEGEYWANTWIPNPRNLFGIKPLLDPYHWEKKHAEDRPYPVTGGTPLRQIPIVGPLIDAPVSAIFKPSITNKNLKRAHEDYLQEINDRYKAFNDIANRGAVIQVYPGGRIVPLTYTSEGSLTGGNVASGAGSAMGTGGTGYGSGASGGYGTGSGSGGSGSWGRATTANNISYINQSYVAYSNVKPIDGRSIGLLRDHTYVDSLDKAMDPNSLAYRLGETAYSMTEIGGMYGFLTNTFTGLEDRMAPKVALQSSDRMYGLQRKFWDENLGGLGGEISEIYRRFLPHKRNQIDEYNPLRNKMPDWMPGLEYFVDFKHGDPFIKIPKGEGRLPGPGYESINKLHSDSMFGRYGALDRFKILADVAPWSEQYKYYDSVISKMREDETIQESDYSDVQRIRDMVKQRKKKYDLYPYKFKYADQIKKQTVTVARMIDAKTFVTDEYPNTPIRMAGIDLPAQDSEYYSEIIDRISKYISPGKKVRIGIASDPLIRINEDTMGTMSAVVYDGWGDPIQAKIARAKSGAFMGLVGGVRPVTADYEDTSATTVNALNEKGTITVGKIWEAFSHLDTPFHTKLLKVRSPLEHYKRQMLYGKDWQSWSNPIRDWVMPTVDKLTSGNPLISTAIGAGIGTLFAPGKQAKAIGAIIGGLVGGIPSSLRSIYTGVKRTTGDFDYTWIPQRRKKEREIEEYFDMLKYVKYKGLYEKARQLAIFSEGLDPNEITKYAESQSDQNSRERRKLKNVKRWLKIFQSGDEGTKDTLKSINNRLNGITGNKALKNAGPMTMRALQYKQEYESTLYGADPYGDLQTIYRALPKKDRPFFTNFMTATPEEREEILRLVPKNQKRFYQAKWGITPDTPATVEQYFMTHYLPDASWAGWKPGVSLEATKLKFVENTALDVGEFGFWQDDMQYAKNAPDLPSIHANPLSSIDVARLTKVLNGAGISNADVEIISDTADSSEGLFNINVKMRHDRRKEVNDFMNANMGYIFS
jgi:hypothetical protein